MEAGWGVSVGVTTNNIHQQIYQLPQKLIEFGIDTQL